MKKKSFKKTPLVLLAISATLLVASTVGSTRAALTYYSENFSAEVTVSNIGVTLLENGEAVGHRNYVSGGAWDETAGVLLENMLEEDEKLALGKDYEEKLSVQNSGAIDNYVRVTLRKSWQDEEGKKTNLSPELIELDILEGNGWVIDDSASTEERIVLYYTSILPVGAETPAFTEAISINPIIGTKVVKTVEGSVVTYEHEYNGYKFVVEADVDAVQTHNAADAIKSAWGVDVAVSGNGSISLR